MIKFWEGTAEALSTRLLSASGPALVFWVWVVGIWVGAHGGWTYFSRTAKPLFDSSGSGTLLALAIAGVIVVGISTLVVDQLSLPILRILEGYWPRWLNRLRAKRLEHWKKQVDTLESLLLASSSDRNVVAQAQRQLRDFPDKPHMMPTRVGNVIQAGERRSADWYGLDSVIVWPQLWLVLPERARNDVAAARHQLDVSVAAFTWALISCGLFFVWSPAILAGLLVAWGIWMWWIPNTAATYAALFSAVFDTQRFSLYDAMHYKRPTGPRIEPDLGRRLTRALWIDTETAPDCYTGNAASAEGVPIEPVSETT